MQATPRRTRLRPTITEAARRTQCKNNLKQVALGFMTHHDTQKHFPTGGWGWFWVGDPDRVGTAVADTGGDAGTVLDHPLLQ